jgi:hypothetical protein
VIIVHLRYPSVGGGARYADVGTAHHPYSATLDTQQRGQAASTLLRLQWPVWEVRRDVDTTYRDVSRTFRNVPGPRGEMDDMNERLRSVMLREGVAESDIADLCGVDPKTVQRWIVNGRVPHARHRWAVARRLNSDEAFLWPGVLRSDRATELVEMHADRATVPREKWLRLMGHAQAHIDVLVMSGTFYAQTQPRIASMLTERISKGARVRLCFSDPDSDAVALRDREERLGGVMAAKIKASLTYYHALAHKDGFELRLHPTTLYASLFRYDDEMMVNPHVYGEPASLNPVMHLRRTTEGGIFDHYLSSFERVWSLALPWVPTDTEATYGTR